MTTFDVQLNPDKETTYTTGEVVTITLTGTATSDPVRGIATVRVDFVASDGTTGSGTVDFATLKPGEVMDVFIDKAEDSQGRVYTIQPGGKQVKATV